LVERIVGLEIEKAYSNLKAVLLEKNCTITAEEVPTFISVRQGSLWGISPVTAKKNVNYHLDAVESGTRIICSSSLAPDWKNNNNRQRTLRGCRGAILMDEYGRGGACDHEAADLLGAG
jgi:hypothetical protein